MYTPNSRQLKTLVGLCAGHSLRQSRRLAGYDNWARRSEYSRFFGNAPRLRRYCREHYYDLLPETAQAALSRYDQ